jgi:hypothetical protein
MKFFSIAIPTYEMAGKGAEFLNFSLDILNKQTFKDFEVVISDHSLNDEVKNVVDIWSKILDIKYFRNNYKRGASSPNLNNAIKNCTGSWIKILFQDDYLFGEDSLKNHNTFIIEQNIKHWLASATERSMDGINVYMPHYPRWNVNMVYGINTISSPSVICFKNEFGNNLKFDENLVWLMDVEFYHRMYIKFGEPKYIHTINIVNRTWESQVSSTLSEEIKNNEHKLIESKYVK